MDAILISKLEHIYTVMLISLRHKTLNVIFDPQDESLNQVLCLHLFLFRLCIPDM